MLRVCLNCYGNYTTDSVYQWDLNHTLSITGIDLSSIPIVHFCNKKSEEAIVVSVNVEGGAVIAPIPNELLMEPYDIIAYLYSFGDSEAKTIEVINIPLTKRPKPTDYIFTENVDIMNFSTLDSRITQYIYDHNLECDEFKDTFYNDYYERLNNGEFVGPPGEKGDPGEKGRGIYSGTSITGTETSGTVFSGSNVEEAILDDLYLNTDTGYLYKCTKPGEPNVAKWIYTGSIKAVADDTTIKANDALFNTTLGYTIKNVLEVRMESYSEDGLTFTVNVDKSVTVNGKYDSTSAGKYATLGVCYNLPVENANYILSGTPENANGACIRLGYEDPDGNIYNAEDYGDGVECTIKSARGISLFIPSGVQYDNVTFYPMLRLADIVDDTYEPYTESVKNQLKGIDNKLTGLSNDNAIVESTLGYTKKNLLKNNAVNSTASGLTFTVEEDGRIYVSGKTTGANNLNLGSGYFLTLQPGNYILSGMENVRGGTEMTLKVYDGNTIYAFLHAGSESKEFTIYSEKSVLVFLNWNTVGTEYSGVISPMIRRAEITDSSYEPYVADIATRLSLINGSVLYWAPNVPTYDASCCYYKKTQNSLKIWFVLRLTESLTTSNPVFIVTQDICTKFGVPNARNSYNVGFIMNETGTSGDLTHIVITAIDNQLRIERLDKDTTSNRYVYGQIEIITV